jgi:hypothetical protein
MKPKIYRVLSEAVENGIKYGWHRAHEHNDEPDQIEIKGALHNAIMFEISEYFHFKDDVPTLH